MKAFNVAPWTTQSLTPAKLAAFYRLVGGDYDPLFLDTSETSLSFIYQSLGCFHTLQPDQDPYSAPKIPALTPQGFVRWQTVQLLLEPEEHGPFLQEAVKRFDLLNPTDGAPFPSLLPKESLPRQPDPDISEWHDAVAQKLMLEAQASAARNLPPRPQMELSDADHESSRQSTADTHDMAGPDVSEHHAVPFRTESFPVYTNAREPPQLPIRHADDVPWSSLNPRGSLPGQSDANIATRASQRPVPNSYPPRNGATRPHSQHRRGDSDLSTISTTTSDSSSVTTSSLSPSPVRHRNRLQASSRPLPRRHSTGPSPPRSASQQNANVAYPTHKSNSAKLRDVKWEDDEFDVPRHHRAPSSRDSRGDPYERYNGVDTRFYDRGRDRGARDPQPHGRRVAARSAPREWR